ncbi:MAG: tRNA (guanosine(37)-N1)-methyltransferase TrmD [Acholeplasmatales bacterium]|nr:tRNA (guanosine(37)-N1)-methyltransferase TrmD [Acholeplasmatales bacterium]
MKIKIVTLFPDMFSGFLNDSIIARAIKENILSVELIDFRTYSKDKHHHVDDTPYGGGAGMVLRCDILGDAIKANSSSNTHKILMSPQGHTYKQADANRLKDMEEIMIICGHYEGFDERVRNLVDEEISIGDFVLTGGEIPAMTLVDSITRLLKGAITEESYEDDSFYSGLLEYPQYTRPLEYNGESVPFVLTNGDHEKIRVWRKKESLRRTYLRRPDLLEQKELNKEEKKLLNEVIDEESVK